MPDEIAKSTGGTYGRVITPLWKLPQHPARKLADEVDQFVEKGLSKGPAAIGTRLARIEAEPIFE